MIWEASAHILQCYNYNQNIRSEVEKLDLGHGIGTLGLILSPCIVSLIEIPPRY